MKKLFFITTLLLISCNSKTLSEIEKGIAWKMLKKKKTRDIGDYGAAARAGAPGS